MSDFTFLTEEQCFGGVWSDEQLDILKKRGTKAALTDFSILLGGYVSNIEHIDGDASLGGRTGDYWTKSAYNNYGVLAVGNDGDMGKGYTDGYINGARLVLPFSSITSIPKNKESVKRAKDDVLEVEYGYYPQKAVPKDMQEILERAYLNRKYI